METKTIPVVGMACASCSAHVERKLNSLQGVQSASVSLPGRSALVEYDPSVISLEQMKAEINGIGYDLIIDRETSVTEIENRAYTVLKRKTILSWVFSLLVMSISMGWIHLGNRDVANQTSMLISLLNLFVCGRVFFRNAWKQLSHMPDRLFLSPGRGLQHLVLVQYLQHVLGRCGLGIKRDRMAYLL